MLTGVAFRYRRDKGIRERLEQLVALEWECCGPGGIDWSFDGSGESLEVRVSVPAQVADSAETLMMFEAIGVPDLPTD